MITTKQSATFENVKIRYSEMDLNLVLKPSHLLNFMQDLATDNAEELGFGYSYIKNKNLAWFLLKYHFEFSNYPEGLYELNLSTRPRGYNKLFAMRDFEIRNKNDLIGRATSTWGLINLQNKAMVNIHEALGENPNFSQYEKEPQDMTYNKIHPLEHVDIEREFEIRFDDLDVNKHVNNSNYIIWAIEPLGFDFRNKYKIKTLDMLFKKEITNKDNVVSQIQMSDTKEYTRTTHALKNKTTGDELCLVQIDWDRIEK